MIAGKRERENSGEDDVVERKLEAGVGRIAGDADPPVRSRVGRGERAVNGAGAAHEREVTGATSDATVGRRRGKTRFGVKGGKRNR